MSTISRVRNSTKRIAFMWTTKPVGSATKVPLDLTGMSLELVVDTEKIESTPLTPVRVANIAGVITDQTLGKAYFPITVSLTGAIANYYFEVWATDANLETYPIDSGQLSIKGGLK